MYYLAIAVGDENHLEYYCRNCGHTDYTIAQEGACIIDTNNKKIHTLKPGNHYNRAYTIHQHIITDTIRKKIITKKNNGTITRPMEWSFTTRCLKYHGITIPVLRISPFNALSSMKPSSFIPITFCIFNN
jgi:hypothetical protein